MRPSLLLMTVMAVIIVQVLSAPPPTPKAGKTDVKASNKNKQKAGAVPNKDAKKKETLKPAVHKSNVQKQSAAHKNKTPANAEVNKEVKKQTLQRGVKNNNDNKKDMHNKGKSWGRHGGRQQNPKPEMIDTANRNRSPVIINKEVVGSNNPTPSSNVSPGGSSMSTTSWSDLSSTESYASSSSATSSESQERETEMSTSSPVASSSPVPSSKMFSGLAGSPSTPRPGGAAYGGWTSMLPSTGPPSDALRDRIGLSPISQSNVNFDIFKNLGMTENRNIYQSSPMPIFMGSGLNQNNGFPSTPIPSIFMSKMYSTVSPIPYNYSMNSFKDYSPPSYPSPFQSIFNLSMNPYNMYSPSYSTPSPYIFNYTPPNIPSMPSDYLTFTPPSLPGMPSFPSFPSFPAPPANPAPPSNPVPPSKPAPPSNPAMPSNIFGIPPYLNTYNSSMKMSAGLASPSIAPMPFANPFNYSMNMMNMPTGAPNVNLFNYSMKSNVYSPPSLPVFSPNFSGMIPNIPTIPNMNTYNSSVKMNAGIASPSIAAMPIANPFNYSMNMMNIYPAGAPSASGIPIPMGSPPNSKLMEAITPPNLNLNVKSGLFNSNFGALAAIA